MYQKDVYKRQVLLAGDREPCNVPRLVFRNNADVPRIFHEVLQLCFRPGDSWREAGLVENVQFWEVGLDDGPRRDGHGYWRASCTASPVFAVVSAAGCMTTPL